MIYLERSIQYSDDLALASIADTCGFGRFFPRHAFWPRPYDFTTSLAVSNRIVAPNHKDHAMKPLPRRLNPRRKCNLYQQAFDDLTSIHVQQIKRYEANTSQPSVDALKKIAKAFGVTTDWLLFEEAERGPDEDLRLQFEAMAQLSPEEKRVARDVLEGLFLKHAAGQWEYPTPRPAISDPQAQGA
jgi:transcriptional regulator with XRE-family HTH domain